MSSILSYATENDRVDSESEASNLLTKLHDQISGLKLDLEELNKRLKWISKSELDVAQSDIDTMYSSTLTQELNIRVRDVTEMREVVQDMINRLTV